MGWRKERSEKKGKKKKEKREKIENWSGSDDLSKSRERLISYTVRSYRCWLKPAKSFRTLTACSHVSGAYTRILARSFARALARAVRREQDSPPRSETPREIQFAGNAWRGASRKPVEPDKLVIERRIFLSFSGEIARPFAVCPTRSDCPREAILCPI